MGTDLFSRRKHRLYSGTDFDIFTFEFRGHNSNLHDALPALAPGDGANDQKRFRARGDLFRQRGVRRFMGQVLSAGEKSHERSPLLRDLIADGPAEHRIPGFEGIENRALRDRTLDLEPYLTLDPREFFELRRERHPDHGRVWTSTESTAGRSRTMGIQLSPASLEAYTCPPVVPKYTPHKSSESTAMASRNTLT